MFALIILNIIGFIIFLAFHYIYPIVYSKWIETVSIIFPILGVILVFFVIFALRNVPSELRLSKNVAALVLFNILGISSLVIGLLLFFNGFNDRSEAKHHLGTVIDKVEIPGEAFPDFQISVLSWRPEFGRYNFFVHRDDYNHSVIGKTKYDVITKRGNFGWEWRSGYQRIN